MAQLHTTPLGFQWGWVESWYSIPCLAETVSPLIPPSEQVQLSSELSLHYQLAAKRLNKVMWGRASWFQQAITNSLETKEKLDNLSKEIENVNKNQREIIELKNTITEIKNTHWMGSMVEITEGIISELEDRFVTFTQHEKKKKEKMTEKKWTGTQGASCKTITKVLTCVSLEFWKKQVRSVGLKYIWRGTGYEFSKFVMT